MGIGKASAPPAPDYAAAAQQTAAGNLANARAATQANRANQYTPYGSLTWAQDANNPDSWTQSINLNDTGQKLLNASNQTSLGLAGLQGNAMGRVADMQSTPFDYGSVKDTQDAAYKGYTSRLDPMWAQNSEMNDAKLANQGIVQGSEAYNNAMRTFNQGKNDAYQQAITGAINTAPQTLQMAQALRSQPLNELNALRSGSQVQNPQFSGYANQGQTAGPDYMGAANAQYGAANNAVNAENANMGNMFGGLAGIGAGYAGSAAGSAQLAKLFSDIRLKSNIKYLGKQGKYNWYEYDKFGKREIGVMAQEVMKVNPDAVSMHESGYLMVNYGAL